MLITGVVSSSADHTSAQTRLVSFFFFLTRKSRDEKYPNSMSLEYEPASEPLHISVK